MNMYLSLCVEKGHEALILEYFDGGSLNNLIRDKKHEFLLAEKIDILRQGNITIAITIKKNSFHIFSCRRDKSFTY